MKAAIFAYSRRGCETVHRVIRCLEWDECRIYTMERFREKGFSPLAKSVYGEAFGQCDALIFVGSCGIAVREIAPWVKDKRTDPAVLCIDELGMFVIPLLSGHIGGANALARELAEKLQATPVITTATDINHKFSVDAWAVRNGYAISSMGAVKAVSAEILEREVPLYSDFPISSRLPSGVIPGDRGDVGIFLTYRKAEPFAQTLRLIPKVLHLGIGSRRGTPAAAIADAVNRVLEDNELDHLAVKTAASIDLKAQEPGLLAFCRENGWPISFYSAEELRRIQGDFTPSAFVQSITGVDNVCERAALLGAEKLIVKKTACSGITVAVAAEHWEVHFG